MPCRVFVLSSFSVTSDENSNMCLLIHKAKHNNGVQSRCCPCFYPPLLSLHIINGLILYFVFDNMLIFLNSRSWGAFMPIHKDLILKSYTKISLASSPLMATWVICNHLVWNTSNKDIYVSFHVCLIISSDKFLEVKLLGQKVNMFKILVHITKLYSHQKHMRIHSSYIQVKRKNINLSLLPMC